MRCHRFLQWLLLNHTISKGLIMGFTTQYTLNDGEVLPDAYISATPTICDAGNGVSYMLTIWRNLEARQANRSPVETSAGRLSFVSELPNNNPKDYLYQLLQVSNLFPDAVWNV